MQVLPRRSSSCARALSGAARGKKSSSAKQQKPMTHKHKRQQCMYVHTPLYIYDGRTSGSSTYCLREHGQQQQQRRQLGGSHTELAVLHAPQLGNCRSGGGTCGCRCPSGCFLPRPCQFDDRTPTASQVLVGERVPEVLVLLVISRVKEMIGVKFRNGSVVAD